MYATWSSHPGRCSTTPHLSAVTVYSSAFKTICNFAAGKILEGSVLPRAVAKLRVQQVNYIVVSFIIFSSLHKTNAMKYGNYGNELKKMA
jgi:hypothetical protein